MDIPINVKVNCSDGSCGYSSYIILKPSTDQVTHIAVRENESEQIHRLVPIDQIEESAPDHILLRCTKADFEKMKIFVENKYMPSEFTSSFSPFFMTWSYEFSMLPFIIVGKEQIPPGEIAIHRGAQVRAVDGHVGQVDEFLVNPTDDRVTHLVMREGHLWGQKDVTIPLESIDRIEENTVYLKLDKSSIQSLPTVPVRRK